MDITEAFQKLSVGNRLAVLCYIQAKKAQYSLKRQLSEIKPDENDVVYVALTKRLAEAEHQLHAMGRVINGNGISNLTAILEKAEMSCQK